MILSWCMIIVRGVWGAFLLSYGSPLSVAAGVSELLGATLSVWNEFSQSDRDRSLGGAFIPIGYLLGMILIPTANSNYYLELCLMSIVIGITAMQLMFLSAYTVGPSSWVRLVETGPYRFVRHPQNLLSLLTRIAFLLGFPSLWNVSVVLVHVVVTLLSIRIEERFLEQRGEYRQYKRRVRYRLVPGLW